MPAQHTLLLVEDEPLILLSVQDALEQAGYAVLAATSGIKAIAIMEKQGAKVSAVITDVRLGAGPDGWELARFVRNLHSDTPIIYATGHGSIRWPENCVPTSVLVEKP
jgi:CheY-like chemotaxis protein